MCIESHEYANKADDDDDVQKPAQSLGTPVPRQKLEENNYTCLKMNYARNLAQVETNT